MGYLSVYLDGDLRGEHIAEVATLGEGGLQVGEGAGEFAFEEGFSVVFDGDRFVEVHHLVVEVEGELSVVALLDVDSVALEGETHGLAPLELVFRGCEPVEVGMGDFFLPPDDAGGVRVALMALQPRKGGCISKVHPVRFADNDMGFVDVALGVLGVEEVEFHTSLSTFAVAVVGVIEGTAPHHEGGVAEVEQGNIAGVSCHHGCSCPCVCHAGCHAPHTVASCGVSDEIYFVGVDIEVGYAHLDEGGIEGIEVGLEPHVPVIIGGTGNKVDAVDGLIELLLVLPLAVVELGGCIPSSVQGDEEAVTIGRFGAESGVPEGHDFAADDEVLVLPSLAIACLGVGKPLGGKSLCFLLRLSLGEVLCGERNGDEGEEENEKVGHGLFFYACGFSFDGEFDAVRLDLDEFTFEEVAHCLLEDFLADTEHGVDFFSRGFVVIGSKTLLGEFEMLEETGGKVTDEDTTVWS